MLRVFFDGLIKFYEICYQGLALRYDRIAQDMPKNDLAGFFDMLDWGCARKAQDPKRCESALFGAYFIGGFY